MNQKKLNQLGLFIKVGLVLIGVICCLMVIGIPNDQNMSLTELEENRDGFAMGFTILYTFGVILITFILVLGFSLYAMITDFKASLRTLIVVGGSIALFLVLYFIGTPDNKETLRVQGDMVVTQGAVNFTHAGLIFLYLTMAIVLIVSLASPWMGKYRK